MSDTFRLEQLIEESRQIERLAEELQAGGPLFAGSTYHVQKFQRTYDAWSSAARELLPSELSERFQLGGEDNATRSNYLEFVANPTSTAPRPSGANHLDEIDPISLTKFRFTYPFESCFREPLIRQRSILLEAKHRLSDSGTPGRQGLVKEVVLGIDGLHPDVARVAGGLFADGHYAEAILRACQALTTAVRKKSGSTIRDDTPLVRAVFSAKKPILMLSHDEGEREGILSLFVGATLGLRNPRAHHTNDEEDRDPIESLEWLAFISALLRLVERAVLIKPSADKEPPEGSES